MGAPACWLPPPLDASEAAQEETAAQESHEPSRPVVAESLSRPRPWTSGVRSIPARHEHARPRPPGAAGLQVTASWLFRVGPRPTTFQHTWHQVWTATAVVFRTQMLKHMKGQFSLLIFTVWSENFPNSKALRPPPPPPPPTTLREPATHRKPRLRVFSAWLPSRIWEEQTGTGISVTVGGVTAKTR